MSGYGMAATPFRADQAVDERQNRDRQTRGFFLSSRVQCEGSSCNWARRNRCKRSEDEAEYLGPARGVELLRCWRIGYTDAVAQYPLDASCRINSPLLIGTRRRIHLHWIAYPLQLALTGGERVGEGGVFRQVVHFVRISFKVEQLRWIGDVFYVFEPAMSDHEHPCRGKDCVILRKGWPIRIRGIRQPDQRSPWKI